MLRDLSREVSGRRKGKLRAIRIGAGLTSARSLLYHLGPRLLLLGYTRLEIVLPSVLHLSTQRVASDRRAFAQSQVSS